MAALFGRLGGSSASLGSSGAAHPVLSSAKGFPQLPPRSPTTRYAWRNVVRNRAEHDREWPGTGRMAPQYSSEPGGILTCSSRPGIVPATRPWLAERSSLRSVCPRSGSSAASVPGRWCSRRHATRNAGGRPAGASLPDSPSPTRPALGKSGPPTWSSQSIVPRVHQSLISSVEGCAEQPLSFSLASLRNVTKSS